MSRFPWQRGRAQLVMLGALAALVVLVSATVSAAAGFVERRSGEISSAALRDASGDAGALVVQTRLAAGEDAAGQRGAWDELVARSDPSGALTTVELLVTDALTLAVEGRPDEATSRTSLAQVDWLPEHADLVAGSWPDQAPDAAAITAAGRLPAALPQESADTLGVGLGDVLLLGQQQDVAVEIVGTWEPRSATDPRWSGFGSVDLSGSTSASGPAVVADLAATDGAGGDPFVRWSLVAGGDAVSAAQVSDLAARVADVAPAADADEAIAPRGTTTAGTLTETLDDLATAGRAAVLVCNVALVLLALIGAATVSQVARLVAQARAGETAILVARGASSAWLARLTWVEAGLVAATGTAAGLGLGALLGGAASPVLTAAALVLWTAAIALPGLGPIRSLSRGVRADVSGRSRSFATAGAALLLLLAAGLSLWRFRNEGERTALDDAIAVAAPGLVTLALAAGALLLLAPVWSALERLGSRVRSTASHLALLAVTRRRAVLSVPLLLVVVAVATSVLGAGYSATTVAAGTQLNDTRVGSDARLELPARSAVSAQFPPRSTAEVVTVDGVASAAMVQRTAARSGQQDLVLEAVPRDAGPVLRGGTMDADALLAAIAPPAGSDAATAVPAVPAGEVTVTAVPHQPDGLFDSDVTAVALTGVLWLSDPVGALARVDLAGGPAELGAPSRLSGVVPDGAWQLLAVDVEATGSITGWEGALQVDLTGIETGGDDVAAGVATWGSAAWPAPADWMQATAVGEPEEGAPTAIAGFRDRATLRLVPSPPTAIPAVVTSALAARLDLSPGAPLTVGLRGTSVPVEVAAVTDLVPGVLDEPAAVVDLALLQRGEALGRRAVGDAGEIWVATTPTADVDATTAELRELARTTSATLVTSSSGAATGTAVAQPVFVAVGLVAILLALVGTLAALDTTARARRGEVIALRALGVPGRVQGRSRLREALLIGGVAVPVGVLVGWLVSLLVVGTLVRLSVPGLAALDQPLSLAPLELGAALLLAAGGIAAVGLATARSTRAQHADTDHREETR